MPSKTTKTKAPSRKTKRETSKAVLHKSARGGTTKSAKKGKATASRPIATRLPGIGKLAERAITTIGENWRVFAWLLIIYAVLIFIIVQPSVVASGDLKQLRASSGSSFFDGFVMLIYMIGSGVIGGGSAGSFNAILAIVMSLAIIWTLRQLYSGSGVRARDAFYKGLAPLVPFVLILVVVSLEMLPGVLGGYVYGVVTANGIAANVAEQILWAALLVLLIALTFYMIASSIWALYIATLPDMTPIKALKSARGLVRDRRLQVLARIVFLAVALVVIISLLMIPVMLYATVVAPAILGLLSIISLFVLHSYMYALYRELIA